MPEEPQAVYMKLGLDTKDVTGRLIFHLPASIDSNLRSERDLNHTLLLELYYLNLYYFNRLLQTHIAFATKKITF